MTEDKELITCPACAGSGERKETTDLPMFAPTPTCVTCIGSGRVTRFEAERYLKLKENGK